MGSHDWSEYLKNWKDKDCTCADNMKVTHMLRYGEDFPYCKYCESGRKLAAIFDALGRMTPGGVFGIFPDNENMVNAVIEQNPVDALVMQRIFMELIGAERSDRARDLANLRHEGDPKQQEKAFVFECWGAWQTNPKQYKSKAEFARAMLDKCEHLTSQKKIEDWCREWEKKAQEP